MGDQALRVAEIVGNADHVQRILKREGRFLAALQFEGNQRRTARHLLGDDVGLRVIGAARIDDLGDRLLIGKEIGNASGVFRLLLDAQRKRFETLQQRPGIEWRHGRTRMTEIVMQVLIDPVLRRQDDAAEATALAVDMLGGGIDDDMRAEIERMLEERGGKHVVHDQLGADLVGELGDAGNVHDFECRVGRAFQEHDLGVRLDRLFPVGEIAAVDQRAADAVFRSKRLDDVAAGAEEGAGCHDMIAGLQLAENGRRDRSHAGCRGAGVFSTFQQAHALLEHVVRRRAVAGIDEAVILALETGFGGGRRLVEEPLGKEDGFRHLAELRAQRSAVYEFSCGLPIPGHGYAPLHNKKTGRKSGPVSHPVLLATYLTWLQADRPNHHGIKSPYASRALASRKRFWFCPPKDFKHDPHYRNSGRQGAQGSVRCRQAQERGRARP